MALPAQPVISGYLDRSREVFIRLSLISFLLVGCYIVLKPFLVLIAWGIILAVAMFPACERLTSACHHRPRLAAAICTAALLVAIIVPLLLLASAVAGATQSAATRFQSGDLHVPPPPLVLSKVPVIGNPLAKDWVKASNNVADALRKLSPAIKQYVPVILSTVAGAGTAIVQFIFSILLAGYLLATSRSSMNLANSTFRRIFHEQGSEFQALTTKTIRNVTNGILGIACLQAIAGGIGFFAIGLPGAALWTVMFLIASVLQIGPIVLLPAAIYGFAIANPKHAVIFGIWCVLVGLLDNVLKPFLLGRGSSVPASVIFLGVIGGFVSMGIVGLFLGAIILSIGYRLFIFWLDTESTAHLET